MTKPMPAQPFSIVLGRVPSALLVMILVVAPSCADDPPMKIRYKLTEGVTQKCPGSCASVTVSCDAVLSIRIVDPVDPVRSYVSVCEHLDPERSLCEMGRIRLPADVELPQRRLAVQVAVYNANDVTTLSNGTPVCPTDQPFDANNFAAPSPYQPAVAGVGYYSPGDAETVVELGCADLTVVNTPTCRGDDKIHITASADDFDNGQFLPPSLAERVVLTVGEPVAIINPDTEQTEYVMPVASSKYLTRVEGSLPTAWSADVPIRFNEAACVEVYEDAAQSTKALSCKRVAINETAIDLRGVRLARSTLMQVLNAIEKIEFPVEGLVIGMVLDAQGKPASNVAVRPSSGTVQYLGPGRDKLSGNVTSNTGIFLSRDTPFNTSWSAVGTSGAYGGLVTGRVTVVILQPDASL